MAKNENVPNPLELLNSTPGGISNDPEIIAMQKGLLSLQYQEVQERIAEKEELKRQTKAAQAQRAIDMDRKDQQERAIQIACPHMKPNLQPALAGQRDHQHRHHFICAYCNKEFTDEDLRLFPHLRLPAEWVGGPNV